MLELIIKANNFIFLKPTTFFKRKDHKTDYPLANLIKNPKCTKLEMDK